MGRPNLSERVRTMYRILKTPVLRAISSALLIAIFPYLLLTPVYVYALPQNWSVESGFVEFSQEENSLTITADDKAVINFESFNINPGEIVRFIQSSNDYSVLSRVTGGSTSDIFGSLFSNGQLVLINPNGITFHDTANVQVGSLIASTLDIQSSLYLSGQMNFEKLDGSGFGRILNEGTIQAINGGNVALLAEQILNTGTIQANLGSVVLGAGEKQTLSFDDHGLINLVVDRGTAANLAEGQQAGISNLGLLQAENGKVLLSAKTMGDVLNTLINNEGIVEATGVQEKGGVIEFVSNGRTISSGTVDASSAQGKGGDIKILGKQVGLMDNARVFASGATGGGEVLIGGDFQGKSPAIQNADITYVSKDAAIFADALVSGNGGKVIVWANDVTRYNGFISAKGGAESGDGGFLEVSGKGTLVYQGQVDTLSANGQVGTLLLDPTDIEIVSAGNETNNLNDVDAFADADIGGDGDTKLDPTAINNAGADVTLQATDDVTFTDAVSMTTNGKGLNVLAGGDITVNNTITTRGGSIFMSANNAGGTQQGNGSVFINSALDTTANGQTGGDVTLDIGGGTGAIKLGANISTDNARIRFQDSVVLTSSITLDTEAGNDNSSGRVQFDGEISADAVGRDLTINTGTSAAGGSGNWVYFFNPGIDGFSNDGGFFVNDVSIDTSGGAGGSAGLLRLFNNIYLDADGADAASFTLTGGGLIQLENAITIDTEQGNTDGETGGAVNFGSSEMYATVAGYTLTINTSNSDAGETGGDVTLGLINNNAGGNNFLSSLVVSTDSATDGVITLGGNISVDSGALSLTGDIRLSGSTTLDTEQGNNGNGGAVTLAGAGVSGTVATADLTINTLTTNVNGSGGNITISAPLSNAGGQYINDFAVDTSKNGAGTAGSLTLSSATFNLNDDGAGDLASFAVTGGGNIILGASVTIDTEQDNDADGGLVDFGTSAVSGNAVGRDLTINTATTNAASNGGSVTLYNFSNSGGNYLNDVTISAVAGAGGTHGNLILNGSSISIDNSGGDSGDFLFINSGDVILGTSVSFDTEQGDDNIGGAVSFGASAISGNAAGRDLSINSSTTFNSLGGTISLGSFNNTGGFYLNDVTFNASGGLFGGSIQWSSTGGDWRLDDDGAGDFASLTVTGANYINVGPANVVIDTEQGNNASGGSISIGNIRGYNGGDLTLDSSTAHVSSDGGDINVGSFIVGGSGGYLNDVVIVSTGVNSSGAITLGGNISLDDDGTGDLASLELNSLGNIILGASLTIDTEQGNTAAGGSVSLVSNGSFTAGAAGRDLTIDTSTAAVGQNGGNILLRRFGNGGGAYVNDVSIATSSGAGGTAGTLTFDGFGSVSLDASGADAADFSVSGSGDIIISNDVTIDTEQGNTNGETGGAVNFGTSNIFADAAGYTLTINTFNTDAGETGGAVTLGLVDDNAGGNNFLDSLVVSTDSATDGVITLGGNISVDSGALSLTGDTRLSTSVTLDTEQGNNGNGGAVTLAGAGVSGTVATADLTINTLTTNVNGSGGNITISAPLSNAGGQYINDFAVDTSKNGAGTAGSLTLSNATFNLNDTGAGDLASFAVTGGGNIILGTSVTLDTEQGDNAAAGSVNFGTSEVSGNAAGRDFTVNASTTNAGSNGGVITVYNFGNAGGNYINDLSLSTAGGAGGTRGSTVLNGSSILLDTAAGDVVSFQIATSNIILGSSVVVDIEQGDDDNAGSINFGGTSTISANAAGLDLTLNNSTAFGGGTTSSITLSSFDNTGGFYVNDLQISNTAATSAGILMLGSIFLDDNGLGDLASLTMNSSRELDNLNGLTIDTEQGNNAAGGDVVLNTAGVCSSFGTFDLTINTSTTNAASAGGNVTLGPVINPVGVNINDLTINTSAGAGGTAGNLVLTGNIELDNNGADTGDFSLTGGGNVILNSSITIDTEDGNSGAGGSINFGTSSISGNAAGRDLTINTATTNAASNGGAVTLYNFGNAGGNYVNDVSITITNGAGGTAGAVTLNGSTISLDDNGVGDVSSLTVAGGGSIILGASVTIDTQIGNNANGGTVDFGTSAISGNAAGRDLTIDTSSSTVFSGFGAGAVTFYDLNNAGGAYLNDLTVTADSDPTSGNAAVINLNGSSMLLDDNGAGDLSSLVFGVPLNGGRIVLGNSLTIDTEQGNDQSGGSVGFGAFILTATAAGRDLTVNTATSAANQSGGTVTLANFTNSSGAYLNDVSIDTSKNGAGTAGSVTLNGNTISLDNNAADLSSFSVTGGGNIILNTSVTIDTENGADAAGGSVDFGTSQISGNAAGRDLTINTASGDGNAGNGTVNGGAVTLYNFGNAGGAYLNEVSIDTDADGTDGSITLNGSTISLDDDGAGGLASLFVSGGGSFILGTTLTIDTEQGGNTSGGFVNFGNSQISGNAAGHDLTIDTSSALNGGAGGYVMASRLSNLAGFYLNDVLINTGGNGGGGDVAFQDQSILLDANAADLASLTITGGGDIKLNSNGTNLFTIDTEQGNDAAGGLVDFGTSDVSASDLNPIDLTINTATTNAASNGGAIVLHNFNNHGNNYMNDVSIVTTAGAGGAAGAVALNGSTISLDNSGADLSSLTFTGSGNIVLGTSVTIDTEQGNNAAGGLVNFGTSQISGNAAGRDLTINTATTNAASNGGAVTLYNFGNTGGNYLNDVSIQTDGTNAYGSITLNGNILVDDNGAGDLGSVTTSSGSELILGANVTIDTEQGNNASAGDVDFGTSTLSGNGMWDLVINTSTTNVASNGGSITFSDMNNSAGSYLNDVSLNTASGAGGTAGLIVLQGDVYLDSALGDDSSFTVTGGGNFILNASRTIDTEQGNDANGGSIDFGTSAVSATAFNRDLTLNTSTTNAASNGGAVTLAAFNNVGGGIYINDVTINTSAGAGGTAGAVTFTNSTINLDNGGADTGDFSVTGGGNLILNTSVTIDTEQGNNAAGGSVSFGTSQVSGDAAGRDLTINTATTNAASNGGAVTLAGFDNAGGAYTNDVSIDTTAGAGGTAGALTLKANISLDDDGAGDLANFSLVGGGNIILNSSLTLDTEQGNDASSGFVDFGTSQISGNAIGRDLVINTATSNGGSSAGDVTLGSFGNAAGNYINDLLINASGAAASGDIIANGDIRLDDNGGGDLSSLTFVGNGRFIIGNDVSIFMELGGAAAAGSITFGNGMTISANAANLDLRLDASSGGGNGAAITIGAVNNDGGQYLNDLIINSMGDSAGLITLNGNISLDNNGADTGDLSMTGFGSIVLGANITIDTEQGNNGSAGSINFGTKQIVGDVAGRDLTINTATTNAASNGGSISFGSFGTVGGSYVNDVSITTTAGAGGTAGDLNLNSSSISLDDNGAGDLASFTVTGGGRISLGASVTVDTEQGNDQAGGAVDISGMTVSSSFAGNDLTINTSTTNAGSNGGNISLGGFSNASGQTVNDLSLNASAGAGGTGGVLSLGGSMQFDANGADSGSFTTTGASAINLTSNTTIDTNSTADGNIFMNAAINGARTLTLDAGTGNITLAGIVGANTAITGLTFVAANTISTQSVNVAGDLLIQGGTWNADSVAEIDIDGIFNLQGGTFTAPGLGNAFTVGDDFLIAGTFNHNNGRVIFDTVNTATIDAPGAGLNFWDFESTTAGKTILFTAADTFNILAPTTFLINGVNLESTVAGQQWLINSNNFNVQNSAARDANNISATAVDPVNSTCINCLNWFTNSPAAAQDIVFRPDTTEIQRLIQPDVIRTQTIEQTVSQASEQSEAASSSNSVSAKSTGSSATGGSGASTDKIDFDHPQEALKWDGEYKKTSTSEVVVTEGAVDVSGDMVYDGETAVAKKFLDLDRQTLARAVYLKMRGVYVATGKGLEVLRARTHKTMESIQTKSPLMDLVRSKTKDQIYLFSKSKEMMVVNENTFSAQSHPLLGGTASDAVLSPDDKHAYVTDAFNDSIEVINLDSVTKNKAFQAGSLPMQATLDQTGKTLFVANTLDGTVSKIDTDSGKTLSTMQTGKMPIGLMLSKDQSTLYVADYGAKSIAVMDVASGSEKARIPTGDGPYLLEMDPQGKHLFASNRKDNTVSIINLDTLSERARITVGDRPSGLAVTPEGNRLYVANELSSNITLIDLDHDKVKDTVAVSSAPTRLVIGEHKEINLPAPKKS